MEKNLTQSNQHFPAYVNELLPENRPFCYIQGREDRQACHIGFFRVFTFASSIIKTVLINPCMGSIPLATFITKSIVVPAIMGHRMAVLIARKINKPVYMSKTHPLCLYVLVSQSSHDYMQDAYGWQWHSFAIRYWKSKQRSGPCVVAIYTAE